VEKRLIPVEKVPDKLWESRAFFGITGKIFVDKKGQTCGKKTVENVDKCRYYVDNPHELWKTSSRIVLKFDNVPHPQPLPFTGG
jgi:hypothetical protein